MKTITLLIAISIEVISCGEKRPYIKQTAVIDSVHSTGRIYYHNPNDDTPAYFPKISQEVYYKNGNYFLHTFAKTKDNQITSIGVGSFSVHTEFYPYENEIGGSFTFIHKNKLKEYSKAQNFFIKNKLVADSVSILNGIK